MNLVIYDLTVDDSGLYHCVVENEGAGIRHVSNSGNIQIKPNAVTMGVWDIVDVVGDYEV